MCPIATPFSMRWGGSVLVVDMKVLMRENGVRTIYTHDADFKRFPFIEVVDPAGKAGR
jgi:hypothetical protein